MEIAIKPSKLFVLEVINFVTNLAYKILIMGDYDDAPAVVIEGLDEGVDCLHIQVVGGFVQN